MKPHGSADSAEVIERLLSKSKTCRSLSPGARELLAESAVLNRLSADEAVWRVGDRDGFCALILSGWVEIFRPTERAGVGASMGIFGAGDVVGLSTAFRNAPRADSALAIEEGTKAVSFFLRPLLEDVDDIRSIELAIWVRELFLAHDHILQDKIEVLQAGSVDQKLLVLFRQLARRFGMTNGSGTVRIPVVLSKTQVARIVDIRVETSIRAINAWRQNGWLTWEPKSIVIPSLDRIAKAVRSN